MKNLFTICFLLLACMAFTPDAHAQSTAEAMTRSANGDTAIINTSTPVVTSRVLETTESVSLQVVVTKNSGTVAGRCECMGSLDGTNYFRAAADTLKLLNVSTAQTHIWNIYPSKYLYYRIRCLGTGTMNARLRGYLYRRKK